MIKFLAIGLIVGLILGGLGGFYFAIDLMVNKIVKLVPIFTNVSINEIAIKDALFKYNNNINSCVS